MKNIISLVIPTFNNEEDIKKCLLSIINQTYKKIEVLIIDGNSHDKTLEIVDEVRHNYSLNIRVLSEKDEGIYDAMNKGIKFARGEWVYFLGSDDVFYNDNVLTEISVYLNEGVDIVYGDVESSRFNGRYGGVFDEEKIYLTNICHQSIFFKKDLFDRIGVFNTRYKAHADWDHNMRWLLNSEISKRYADIVVAIYSDGGYSSINGDPIFKKDRRYNYLKYSCKTRPFNKNLLKRLAKEEIRLSLRTINLKRMYLGILIYLKEFLHA